MLFSAVHDWGTRASVQWEHSPELVPSLFLEVFRPKMNKFLRKLLWPDSWPCCEEEVGLETSWDHFQLKQFCVSIHYGSSLDDGMQSTRTVHDHGSKSGLNMLRSRAALFSHCSQSSSGEGLLGRYHRTALATSMALPCIFFFQVLPLPSSSLWSSSCPPIQSANLCLPFLHWPWFCLNCIFIWCFWDGHHGNSY